MTELREAKERGEGPLFPPAHAPLNRCPWCLSPSKGVLAHPCADEPPPHSWHEPIRPTDPNETSSSGAAK